MNVSKTKNLVSETFNFPFDENKFSNFSYNLFDNLHIDESFKWNSGENLPESLKESVSEFKIFGDYKYPNGEKIIIAMIKLSNANKVEKSRHIQRDFAKWLLDKNNADACLVSFFADNYDDWRFSLIKMNYERVKDKKGKIKAIQKLTPLTRYSYLVGKNEPNHTAQVQLAPLFSEQNKNPSLDRLVDAFSIEKVTKNFYLDYVKIFKNFENYISKNYSLKSENLRLFTQTLFNRIMFIRFLEKKNWLSFNGSKKYLNTLFKNGNYKNSSFYKGRLTQLFFLGLGKKGFQENEAYGNVCFLNGGLFEKNFLDTKVKDLPNFLFNDIFNDDGLFYRYNFTVEESTPLDIQVSVDPEMLGKVFEELTTSRNESGAFYTKREIVSFMCRESLKKYFKVENFLNLENVKQSEIKKIIYNISDLKILDPACGSGAYIVGMLDEIYKVYDYLIEKKYIKNKISKYQIKKKIIENNIYGVDIDESAVQIARLRLWLSLIIDYKGSKPEPLPNLDLKIETGDSLLTQNVKIEFSGLFASQAIEELKYLKDKFQNSFDKTEKEIFLNKINKIKNDLKENYDNKKDNFKNQFEWLVEFAEVFKNDEVNSGFDIVISNPPYEVLDNQNKNPKRKEYKQLLKENLSFVYSTKGQLNLFRIFIERGIQLLKENGIICYINPNTLLADKSSSGLRNLIRNNLKTNFFLEFPESSHVFENVSQAVVIFLCEKISKNDNFFNLAFNLKIQDLNSYDPIKVNWQDIDKITGKDLNIPLIKSQSELNILKKLHTLSKYSILKKSCKAILNGDIHLTHHKKFLSNRKTKNILIRGEHIQRYKLNLSSDNSDRRWFNFETFEKEMSEKKLAITISNMKQKRIVMQNIANLSLKNRLIASICPPNCIVGHSAEFLIPRNINIYCMLGIINSKLLNWRFKITSSNNHVNIYELELLPFPHSIDPGLEKKISQLTKIILDKSGKNQNYEMEESNLNNLIFKIYGITEEEKKFID